MSFYNERGNIRVTVDDTSFTQGVYATDGSIRITVVDGTSFTGAYAPDGSWYVVQVTDSETPVTIYHPCGAIRGVPAVSEYGLMAPNGAFYMEGLDTANKRLSAATGTYLVVGSDATLSYSAITGPTDGLLLEDGTSFYLLEDGTSYYTQESA